MENELTRLDPYSLLALLAFLMLCSAFFSGSETALLGFDWLRLRYLVRKGNRRARMLERLLAKKDLLIGTILVGNNIANVAASAIATALALSYFGDRGIALATGVMTLVLLIFAEIAPKTFASRHSEQVGLTVAPAFVLFTRLLYPLVILVTFLSNGLLRLFGVPKTSGKRKGLTEEEIRTLLTDEDHNAAVAESKRHMLHGIFQMSRQTVREVMVPRTRVIALDASTPVDEACRRFLQTGYTRLPVYREAMEQIAGIAHARDALALLSGERKGGLATILRDTFFVPETMTLEELLYQFQQKRTHMAMVVDEYGGVEGIVTLEDVLEEIVGEIRDEHDMEGEAVRFLPGGEALVQGSASIRDVNQALKLELPTETDVTLGGFVMTQLGRIPDAGESFLYGECRFLVERTGRHRVLVVRVTPIEPTPLQTP